MTCSRQPAPSEGPPENTNRIWRQCVCGAWYWGAPQTDADKAHSRQPAPSEGLQRAALYVVFKGDEDGALAALEEALALSLGLDPHRSSYNDLEAALADSAGPKEPSDARPAESERITDANGDELERGEPDYPGQYDEVMSD